MIVYAPVAITERPRLISLGNTAIQCPSGHYDCKVKHSPVVLERIINNLMLPIWPQFINIQKPKTENKATTIKILNVIWNKKIKKKEPNEI